jgi:HEPN domain-containing protein
MVTLEDAKEIAKTLAINATPVAVIAFGSVARQGQGHDLDLLIVTAQESNNPSVEQIMQNLCDHFAIDYLIGSVDSITRQFRNGSPFLGMIQQEGRILFMDNSFREWETLAREDLNQGTYLSKGGFFRGACFAAQQAVEKAVKGELLKRGWELEKIHQLRRLLHIAKSFNLNLEYEGSAVDFIDSIYRGRYPAEEGLLPLKNPTREDAERALKTARDLLGQLGYSDLQQME